MLTHEFSSQKDSPKESAGFVTSSNENTGRPSHMQPRWKLAGIDQEGAHHALQIDDAIIYAIQNGRVVAKERLDDWRVGRTITAWRNYVAEKRGRDTFYLQIIDFSTAFTTMVDHPRR